MLDFSNIATAIVSQAMHWLLIAEHELLIFSTFWFILSAIDEAAIDLSWLWLKLTGRAHTAVLPQHFSEAPLTNRTAIFVAAWQEHEVIREMISHALKSWKQKDFTLYVGCYPNDPQTVAAAINGAANDPRVRLVINAQNGPTTKADCLNRLYSAMQADETRYGTHFRNVIMHDAEDMVHPSALVALDNSLIDFDFVQLPVRPEPQPSSPWIAGHYSDEFTEAHTKTLVVRDALGAAIPAAGVGCGFSRAALDKLAIMRSNDPGQASVINGPFAADCLTEDYELGLLITKNAGHSKFLRMRDHRGELIATRSYFPATLETSVRQKTRWVHGIALQSWERLGWNGRPLEIWMALRDRRGPLTAVVLAASYLFLIITGLLGLARLAGWQDGMVQSAELRTLIMISLLSLAWRIAFRFIFTAREYGVTEGIRAILRIPVANIISIMAGRRAIAAYMRSLSGAAVSWDKTAHAIHPAKQNLQKVAA